jgi:hypothetical protein
MGKTILGKKSIFGPEVNFQNQQNFRTQIEQELFPITTEGGQSRQTHVS